MSVSDDPAGLFLWWDNMELLSLLKTLSDQNNQMDMQTKIDTLQDSVILLNKNIVILDDRTNSMFWVLLLMMVGLFVANFVMTYLLHNQLDKRLKKLED